MDDAIPSRLFDDADELTPVAAAKLNGVGAEVLVDPNMLVVVDGVDELPKIPGAACVEALLFRPPNMEAAF